MKRIKYTMTSLLLGAMLVTSPVLASTPAEPSPASEPAMEQPLESTMTDAEIEEIRKKAREARQQVIAVVNGAEINMYDFVGMMNRVSKIYFPNIEEPTDEITAEVKKISLNRLIFEELAVKEAIKQGIKPPPEKLDEVIANLRQTYGSSEGYQNYLDDLGITEEQFKQRIVRSQLLEGITGREVYQKQIVKEDAIANLYKEYKEAGKLRRADEFVVKEILVMEGEDKEATRKRAEQLHAELMIRNYDFGKLVLDGTFIVRKIRVKKDKYPTIFAEMEKMKVGDFSNVVEDDGTYHIFKVLQNDPARDHTEEEARGMLEDKLAVYFQEQRRAEWINELRKDAEIEIKLDDLRGIYEAAEKAETEKE